jgi:hypothetical protein
VREKSHKITIHPLKLRFLNFNMHCGSPEDAESDSLGRLGRMRPKIYALENTKSLVLGYINLKD